MQKTVKLCERNSEYVKRRIPGVVVLPHNGNVLCYHEARKFDSDRSLDDVSLQISTDFGETFGEPAKIACSDPDNSTFSNPCMVLDKINVLHMLYAVPGDYNDRGGMVYHTHSHDGGKTWSTPVNIIDSLCPQLYDVIAPGPGHGICTKDGKLIFAAFLTPKYFKNTPKGSGCAISTIYSCDNGKTWALGEVLSHEDPNTYPNECMIVQLSDGSFMLDVRTQNRCRAQTFSKTGFSNWSPLTFREDLPDAVCFGSVISYNAPDKPYTLFMANCTNPEVRDHIRIRYSLDDGKTWSEGTDISGSIGGYADLAADPRRGLIYAVYEEEGGYKLHLFKADYDTLTK